MTKHKLLYGLVVLTMAGLNTAVGIAAYWYFFDVAPPTQISYRHDAFTDREVSNREDAQRYSINEARVDQTIYRYVEYCVDRVVPGTVNKTWVDGVMYSVPATPTAAQIGCFKRSIAETVPPIPGHLVKFYVSADFQLNPLKTVKIAQEPLALLVLR